MKSECFHIFNAFQYLTLFFFPFNDFSPISFFFFSLPYFAFSHLSLSLLTFLVLLVSLLFQQIDSTKHFDIKKSYRYRPAYQPFFFLRLTSQNETQIRCDDLIIAVVDEPRCRHLAGKSNTTNILSFHLLQISSHQSSFFFFFFFLLLLFVSPFLSSFFPSCLRFFKFILQLWHKERIFDSSIWPWRIFVF